MTELRQATEPELRATDLGRSLVEQWRAGASPAGERSIPATATGSLPLSPAQRRLWFLEQLSPGTTARVVGFCARLSGSLDEEAFGKSVENLARRHDILRATVRTVDGEPLLEVDDTARVAFSAEDLRRAPEGRREAEALRRATAAFRDPFDLERGPLVRVALLRTGAERHLLSIVAHHLVCDGWSLGVALRELAACYAAYASGAEPELPPLPVRYRDVAAWEVERAERGDWHEALEHWTARLADLPTLDLPADRPRPAVQTARGGRTPVRIPGDVAAALGRHARESGATLFMALLAAFQVLLLRLTGHDDVPVGSPAATRRRPELQGLIGPLVNLLVLRGDLSGDPTFRELLRRTRDLCVEAYACQEVPFERVVQELGPTRTGGAPLVQVAFTMQNAPLPATPFGALSLERVELEPDAVQYDLDLEVWELPAGLEATLGYSSDLFDAPTAARLAGHLEVLLADACRRPDTRIGELELLTPAERRRILRTWNDTAAPVPDRCLHELFEEQAARTPSATAVVDGEGELTYAELNGLTNQLARRLRSEGIGPESIVGVCMERSPELVVSLLGILKAGGAYLPLDPDYPAERRVFVLDDAGAALVLSHAPVADRVHDLSVRALLVDEEWGGIVCESSAGLEPLARAENPAYVIHTSGSTGTPKGVVVPHAGIRNRVLWTVRTHGLGPADRVLQKTTLTFDAAAWEFLAPLVSGGSVVLAPPDVQHDPRAMVEAVADRDVTVLQLVPSVFKLVVEEPGLERCRSLRLVFCAGEPLPVALCERLFERLPQAELHNTYGPTECSIDVTAYRCRPGMHGPIVSIGRPIANTRVYVLDRALRPVPVGVTGELYAGGAGLGRGYLNRPALTAERFVPDPFDGRPGARLYRTGDLARYQADGNLEFVGRIDHQVKIRGFRIELGEVESALAEHPEVEQAVVVAREDEPGERRLVAYLVCAESEPSASELRAHVRQKLPEYMVPSAFVLLATLPLTRSGKVDRKALPPPDASRPELEQAYVAPRTPVEELVARVWADVLSLEKVGVHDSFFELGGHSLLATRVVNRLGEAIAADVPLRLMFERPALADFAHAVTELRPDKPRVPEIRRLPRVPRSRLASVGAPPRAS
jgi:amino acid adenylation domain-containing protein